MKDYKWLPNHIIQIDLGTTEFGSFIWNVHILIASFLKIVNLSIWLGNKIKKKIATELGS